MQDFGATASDSGSTTEAAAFSPLGQLRREVKGRQQSLAINDITNVAINDWPFVDSSPMEDVPPPVKPPLPASRMFLFSR